MTKTLIQTFGMLRDFQVQRFLLAHFVFLLLESTKKETQSLTFVKTKTKFKQLKIYDNKAYVSSASCIVFKVLFQDKYLLSFKILGECWCFHHKWKDPHPAAQPKDNFNLNAKKLLPLFQH